MHGTEECTSVDDADVAAAFEALERAFAHSVEQAVRTNRAARAKALHEGALFWRCFRFTHNIPDMVPAPLYFFEQRRYIAPRVRREMFVVFDGATLIIPFQCGHTPGRKFGSANPAELRVEGQAAGAHGWIGCGERTVDRRVLSDADDPARATVAAFEDYGMLNLLLNACLNFDTRRCLFAVHRKYFPDGAYPLTPMQLCTPGGPLLIGDGGHAVMFDRAAHTLVISAGLPACLDAVRDNEAFWWDVIGHLSDENAMGELGG